MDKNIEKINKYLTNINLPQYSSDQHRQKLRLQVINRNGMITIMKNRMTKFAAVLDRSDFG